MLMEKERQEIVEYGKRMSSSGLTNGTSGNLSIYNKKLGYMAISPSGVGYFETTIKDIVIIDLEGNHIDGDCTPSSEFDLHATIYRKYPDVRAVVHTHSTYCTTYACLNKPIQAIHYLIAGAETSEVPCVEYATYGSKELAQKVMDANVEGLAMLLANHGMVSYGASMAKAFNVAENVEWCAEIQWRSQCIGTPDILSHTEIGHVIHKFKNYGQTESEKTGY